MTYWKENKLIKLEPITKENIDDIVNLSCEESQKFFVATPMKSLAYAFIIFDNTDSYGIYNNKQLIGYTSITFKENEQAYYLRHFLIDKAFQGQGHGRTSLDIIMNKIKEKAIGKTNTIRLEVDEPNKSALHLYKSLGFKDTGKRASFSEIIMERII